MVRLLSDMTSTRRSTIVVVTLALVLLLPLAARPVSAQDGSEPSPFDMNTDSDGNGIPDEFESAYNELARAEGLSGVERFVNRIPVSQDTLRLKSKIDTIFSKYQSTSSPERRQALWGQIQAIADQMARDDPVHAAALRYMDVLSGQSASAAAGAGGASSSGSAQDYEDEINQRGDVLFIRYRGFTPAWLWTMDWSHVGMYDGRGMVYESDTDLFGPLCNGVERRSISKFIRNDHAIRYGQLADSSGRSHVSAALSRAQTAYGTGCSTPYNYVFSDKWTTSRMYCSQLVWRTYKDIGNYSVDLDSNHWRYQLWLTVNYSAAIAATIGIPGVAPDEIALDPDLDGYYETIVRLN